MYVTNWYFIHHATGYFGADLTNNPVLPFWSLAIEEQFYLLWPLTLGGLFWFTRNLPRPRRIRTIQIIVAVAAVASALWALSLRHTNPNRAYYGTDARAYELFAGALLALVPTFVTIAQRHQRAIRTTAIAALGVVIFLATSAIDADAIVRGIAITLTTVILLTALEAAHGGLTQRLLSHNTIVYLGKISYGTYLWHWLVIIVITRTFHLSTLSTIAITTLVATALASLSYEILERPVRLSALLDTHRTTVIITGLAISAISALILIPNIVDPANATNPTLGTTTNTNIDTTGFTPVPSNLDWRHAAQDAKQGAFPNCLGKPPESCTIVHGTGKHILLIGDSHGRSLIPTFTAIAEREHLTLSVEIRGACPWQRKLFARAGSVSGTALRPEDCKRLKEDLYTRVIPALHPDLIIAVNYGYEVPGQILPYVGPNGKALKPGPAENQWLESTTTDAVKELRATGAEMLIVEPIPFAPKDPLDCLSKAKVTEECSYVVPAKPDALELFYRQLAKQDDGVRVLDLDRVVCPYLPICDPVVNGVIVKWDTSHLTVDFAKSIAPQVDAYLKQSGALRP